MGHECQDYLARLSEYLDGECPADVEAFVRHHMEDCPPCGERAEFESALRAMVASKCRDQAPAGLAQNVLQRLNLPGLDLG